MMIVRFEKLCVFLLGGIVYGICEILWRGYTHWTMILLGGMCFTGLYLGQKRFGNISMTLRCISGGVFITSLELVTGSIVNTALGMDVWDYSQMPFNLYGQVCLQFFCAWVVLCIPALFLCRCLCVFFDRLYV